MEIVRIDVGPRMSQAVVHGGLVYTAGQVALGAPGSDAGAQTADILGRIDGLLSKAGTDKSRVLSATIWLSDMAHFGAMNAVWDEWVVEGHTPGRATVESKLAAEQFTVEIAVIAAL